MTGFLRGDSSPSSRTGRGDIEAREQRLVEGIARGDRMDPLLAQLKVEESRKATLTHELATLVDLARVASLETKRIQQALIREATRMRDLLGRHVPGAGYCGPWSPTD